MRAVFLDYATVDRGDLDARRLERSVDQLTLHPVSAAGQVLARLAEADIAILNKIRLDAEHLTALPRLQLICLAATGTDNIDLAAARRRGIAVANIRRYCTASVVQHVFAVLLSLTHRLDRYRRLIAEGAWRDSPQFTLLEYPIRELAGRLLGIVGLGELGSGVARVAECFGMRVEVANRPGRQQPGRVDLEALLPRVDVLSLHCPLTEETRGLIDARTLALMKPDAVLINTARGGLVDSRALVAALREGRLGGAAIDVLAQEPPVDGDPLLAPDVPNLLLTPHIAWAAAEARQRALDEIAANIEAYRSGERRNRVD